MFHHLETLASYISVRKTYYRKLMVVKRIEFINTYNETTLL